MDKKDISTIITRIKGGDHNAFTVIVEAYKDMVYSLCMKMTHSNENAEEIAQDAFVKAFHGIHKFKGQSKFSTWLYQITYYTCINYLRKKRLNTTSELSDNISDSDPSILEQIEQDERARYIEKALSYLTPEERALITLYYLEERPINEISIITKLSTANVKVKLHRTRKKLYGVMQALLKNELN